MKDPDFNVTYLKQSMRGGGLIIQKTGNKCPKYHNFKETLSNPSSIPLPRAGDRKLNNPFNVASLKF